MSGVTLELLTDPDMYLFVERGIRGGISMISHRYANANNPYLENYNESLPNSYIMYLDANNLYGWAMSQALPTHGFEWAEGPVDFMKVDDNAEEGYILEVDLEYPAHLHPTHNDYPLAPEPLQVTEEMLSPYTQDLMQSLHIQLGNHTKLTPNLQSKSRYVVHYRNLKLYVSLGLVVTRIHRVLKFQQSPWLRSYIQFNTEQRKQAQSSFAKDLFKLLNNSVFGKTMENLRNRINIDLVHHEKKAKKLVAAPTFHAFKIIAENLVAVERRKATLVLNRPIYVGFSILDLSKTLMYSFHYHQIQPTYGPRAQLLFTDTDSLCYKIETQDIYKDMSAHLDLYDTSDYPSTHPLHSTVNKKILGKMKDELAGEIVQEFIGLKPKMYSLLSTSHEKKTAKGVSKLIVKRHIRHRDYYNCLFLKQRGLAHGQRIATHRHQVHTLAYGKITLCPIDTKRYLLEDGVTSYAYGHCQI